MHVDGKNIFKTNKITKTRYYVAFPVQYTKVHDWLEQTPLTNEVVTTSFHAAVVDLRL